MSLCEIIQHQILLIRTYRAQWQMRFEKTDIWQLCMPHVPRLQAPLNSDAILLFAGHSYGHRTLIS